jgi:hypothetical protein
MNILVIYAHRMQSHFDVFPIRVFRHFLRDLGINVAFTQKLLPSDLLRFDLVLLVQLFLYDLLPAGERSADGVLRLLDQYDRIGIPVIWLDASDTVGPINRAVLDRVRVYAVRQLLKNRIQYTLPMLHGSPVDDYYYRTFDLSLPNSPWFASISGESLDKLAVFWNIALSDWRILHPNRLRRAAGILFPNPAYQLRLTAPDVLSRPIDITCRVSTHSRFAAVNFHRELVKSATMQMADHYVVRAQGKVPYHIYAAELRAARIVVLPFGRGEICYRDFEAFAAGSIVVKPDMSHLDTFPECYFPNQTYIAHRWDMSDFADTIQHILTHIDEYQQIAHTGQRRFIDVCGDGESFAIHFHALIKKALSPMPNASFAFQEALTA